MTKITTIRLTDASLEEIEYLHDTLHLNTSSIIRLAISKLYAEQKRKNVIIEKMLEENSENFIEEV